MIDYAQKKQNVVYSNQANLKGWSRRRKNKAPAETGAHLLPHMVDKLTTIYRLLCYLSTEIYEVINGTLMKRRTIISSNLLSSELPGRKSYGVAMQIAKEEFETITQMSSKML